MKKNEKYLEIRHEFDKNTETDKFYYCLPVVREVGNADFKKYKNIKLKAPSIAALLALGRVYKELGCAELYIESDELKASSSCKQQIILMMQNGLKKLHWEEKVLKIKQYTREYKISD